MSRLILLACTILVVCLSQSYALDPVYMTASTGRTRAIGMGGAFTAVTDHYFSAQGNPANQRTVKDASPFAIRYHLNPLQPLAVFATRHAEPEERSDAGSKSFALAGLVKGVSLKYHALMFKLSLFDISPLAVLRRHNTHFINAAGLLKNHSNTFAVNFQLASSIAMGASGSLYYQEDEGVQRYGGGISYGLLMKPSARFHIGLVYYNFPDEFQFFRQTLDRLSDETINGGIAYQVTDNTLLALDLRNMTDDDNVGARELHVGVETKMFKFFTLRGGLYGERGSKNVVCSLGAGLARGTLSKLPWWNHGLDAFDYSMMYEMAPARVWHALTFIYSI